MQMDGNLVQYPSYTRHLPSDAYWATGTFGSLPANVNLAFDDKARLCLVNASASGVNIHTISGIEYSGRALLMRIDADGIFRVFSHTNGSWSAVWSSTKDACIAKGLCGSNSYCELREEKADCTCLPGFDFVHNGSWTAECVSSFVGNNCTSDATNLADIKAMPKMSFENNFYLEVSVDNQEGCRRACLEDCNCEAAFYEKGNCQKQRLPLTYGRRLDGTVNTAFIKVYTTQPAPTTGAISSPRKIRQHFIIINIFLVSLGLVMLIVSVIVVLYKNKIRGYSRIVRPPRDVELLGEEITLKSFTFKEMERITGEFKEEIGRGSFGTVYKGEISSGVGGREGAVKRLEKVLEEGEQEFQNEMRAIGRTNHKNLVRLIGYCHDGPNRLLVYEYMWNGPLAEMLFMRPNNQPNWDERIEIVSGIGGGIMYLHEECKAQIIHCDIKPQNILIDEHRCGKISDFGLAKLLKADHTKTFTGIRGTRGYVAPEWHRKQPITVKADVYSFGIVLLEIICCRRNVDWELLEEEAVLEDWAYDCFEMGEVARLVKDEYKVDKKQLKKMIKVALWCVQDEPSLRPSMKKVLLMLEGTVDIPIPPSPRFFS